MGTVFRAPRAYLPPNVIGAVLSGSPLTAHFYLASVQQPGRSSQFFSSAMTNSYNVSMDPYAASVTLLEPQLVAGGLNTLNHLHWISSQIANYDLPISRADTQTGVLQAAFVPW